MLSIKFNSRKSVGLYYIHYSPLHPFPTLNPSFISAYLNPLRAAAISELAIWPAKITLCRMNCKSANHRIKYTQTRRLASIFFLLNLSRGGPVCSEQKELTHQSVPAPRNMTRPALPYDYTIYMLCRRYSICIRNYREYNNLI